MEKMVKENKVKAQKVKQKSDLQEPQKPIENVTGVNGSKSEEPETTEGMVHCKACGEDVEPYMYGN